MVYIWVKFDNFIIKNSFVVFGVRCGSFDVYVILFGFGWLWISGGGGCVFLNYRKLIIKGFNFYDLF